MTEFEEKIRAWARFVKTTRSFFDDRGFLEVFTPHLVEAGAFESAIETLRVDSLQKELHTSPEIEMKFIFEKLQQPIYQIAKVFRDDDPNTQIHLKEFTMLEFYRPEATCDQVMRDSKELLNKLAGTDLNWKVHRLPKLLQEITHTEWEPFPGEEVIRENLKGVIELSPKDSAEDMFLKLMIEKVEPSLEAATPTILNIFPESLSPLSKSLGNGWADRFEIYWNNMEIANGCTELTSLEKLKKRYEVESQKRIKAGKKPHPYPTRLFDSAQSSYSASGVAIGLDRLFWAVSILVL